MTHDEIERAKMQIDAWIDYFETHRPQTSTLSILRSVVLYARYLEDQLAEKKAQKSHSRPGWWSRFRNILGDN